MDAPTTKLRIAAEGPGPKGAGLPPVVGQASAIVGAEAKGAGGARGAGVAGSGGAIGTNGVVRVVVAVTAPEAGVAHAPLQGAGVVTVARPGPKAVRAVHGQRPDGAIVRAVRASHAVQTLQGVDLGGRARGPVGAHAQPVAARAPGVAVAGQGGPPDAARPQIDVGATAQQGRRVLGGPLQVAVNGDGQGVPVPAVVPANNVAAATADGAAAAGPLVGGDDVPRTPPLRLAGPAMRKKGAALPLLVPPRQVEPSAAATGPAARTGQVATGAEPGGRAVAAVVVAVLERRRTDDESVRGVAGVRGPPVASGIARREGAQLARLGLRVLVRGAEGVGRGGVAAPRVAGQPQPEVPTVAGGAGAIRATRDANAAGVVVVGAGAAAPIEGVGAAGAVEARADGRV